MPRQLWIPKVLRDFGLTVYEEDGWEKRGSTSFDPIGVMWHHTATPNTWSSRQLTDLLVKGHSSLRGPLCHLQLNRDGVYIVIAAGRANHAGRGDWPSIKLGNTQTIGIEAANDGVGEVWPQNQIDAYIAGTRAILNYLNQPVENVIGHKEWAPSRKIDPAGIDMPKMREDIKNYSKNTKNNAIPSIPNNLSWGSGGLPNIPNINKPILKYRSRGKEVQNLQKMLSDHGFDVGKADGIFGPKTLSSVKKFQLSKNLVSDGIVGPITWSALESSPHLKNTTENIKTKPPFPPTINIKNNCRSIVLRRRSKGNCVSVLQRSLNVLGYNSGAPDGHFGPKTENAVKRFQESKNISVDGIVGPQTWSKF